VDEIESKFAMIYHALEGGLLDGAIFNIVTYNTKLGIQNGGRQTGFTRSSLYEIKSKFQIIYHHFRGRSNRWCYSQCQDM